MSTNYVRLQSQMEERLFRFKNEPKDQPLESHEPLAERRVHIENVFNDIMSRALSKAHAL
jgi:hypothetical protein